MRPLFDIHCHGALGQEFGGSVEGNRIAAAHHRDAGTTTMLASLVSGTPDMMERSVRSLAPLVADGTVAGIHLEGPFLSHERRGAHDPGVLTDPDPALIDRLVDVAGAPGVLRQMTFAPERPGAQVLVDALVAHDITPAIGHTDADAATVTATIGHVVERSGRPALVTHLFNGMPPMHHRAGGPVAAALTSAARGEALVELIADGVHVHAEVVRMVFETVGPQAIVLVSDAMSATGLADGPYRIGELAVEVIDNVARLTEGGSIAGSTTTLSGCVDWCIEQVGLPVHDVFEAASSTPARAVGVDAAP